MSPRGIAVGLKMQDLPAKAILYVAVPYVSAVPVVAVNGIYLRKTTSDPPSCGLHESFIDKQRLKRYNGYDNLGNEQRMHVNNGCLCVFCTL